MSYLEYHEYKGLGGELDAGDYERYEIQAEQLINRDTFGRIEKLPELPEEVKRLTFELIELNRKSDMTAEALASERVGDWQKSYRSTSAASYTRAKSALIRTYLSGIFDPDGIPLLYRGVDV